MNRFESLEEDNNKINVEDEILEEYDFTGGVRGKYIGRIFGRCIIEKSSLKATNIIAQRESLGKMQPKSVAEGDKQ